MRKDISLKDGCIELFNMAKAKVITRFPLKTITDSFVIEYCLKAFLGGKHGRRKDRKKDSGH